MSDFIAKREILRAFLGVSAVSVVARLAQIVMAVILARALTPDGYGSFVFATGVALIGGRLGALGWPVLMMRFIPTYSEAGDWHLLNGLLKQSFWVVLGGSFFAAGVIGIGAGLVGSSHHLFDGLVLGALLLPCMSFQALRRNQLAGLKRPAHAVLINELIPPTLLVVSASIIGVDDLRTAGAAYIVAHLASLALGTQFVVRFVPPKARAAEPSTNLWPWMKTALPALVGTSALLLMNKIDVLMLAPLSNLTEVGYYGVAQRLTYLQTAPVILLSVILSPRLSSARAAKRFGQFNRLFFGALAFSVVASLPLGAILFLGRDSIISLLFGSTYLDAAPVLSVLVLSQIVAALTIPTTSLLLMAGEQNKFGMVMGSALLFNVALNFWLVPIHGALGAAIATTCVMSLLFAAQLSNVFKVMAKDSADKKSGN